MTVKRNLLAKFGPCPHTGGGVNAWIYKVVCSLLVHRVEVDEIWRVVKGLATGCGRRVDQDIAHALETAPEWLGLDSVGTGRGDRGSPTQPRWPDPAPWKQREVQARYSGITRKDLTTTAGLTVRGALSQLYPAEGLVCCGPDEYHHVIWPVDIWIDGDELSGWQFIVPSLMKHRLCYDQGKLLRDKLGNPSVRRQDNVLKRLYLIIDFDKASHDEQAKYIAYLAQLGPLVMVVDTGGKSLHAWFRATDASEAKLEEFFREACQLGADKSKWGSEGYVRLPGGLRQNNRRRQSIIYFDPRRCVKPT
jgi:hypothetical protein